MSSEVMLKIDRLSIEFQSGQTQSRPVRDVSLSIQHGEAVALVGESGSGKSLTALAVMGLLPKEAKVAGSIEWYGKSASTIPNKLWAGRKVAMIFQDPVSSLNPSYTIGYQLKEAIAHAASVASRRLSNEEIVARAVELLEEVGIDHPKARMNSYPHELSGGMNQRVGIALALACEPELLIADEPTTALDVTVQKQILDLLARLQRIRKMSVLLITHDLAVASALCSRIAVMYAGQIVEIGEKDSVIRAPLHPYTRGLLAARPTGGSTQSHGFDTASAQSPLSGLGTARRGVRLQTIVGSVPTAAYETVGCRFQMRCEFKKPECTHSAVPLVVQASSLRLYRCISPLNSAGES